MKKIIPIRFLILILPIFIQAQDKAIHPSQDNPYYWEYQNEKIMLLGGSKDDNLFQIPDLKEHLDLMQSVGANYVRNTMSSRDPGNVHPFQNVDSTVYDLSKWNDEYWNRFQNFLQWTSERGIIVQIEIWAFHDFFGEWEEFLPWNPKYNINYSETNTQLKAGSYGNFWDNTHDFFYTVPALHNDTEVLKYQQAFVDKILSYSLNYGNVLYCMTNEIFTQFSPEWGWYWADYIRKKAEETGKDVYVAEMYQNHDLTHEQHRATLDHPEIYGFIDISQNSRQLGDTHWEKLNWVRNYIKDAPRPINHTKTYGGDEVDWTDGDEEGIRRFWKNILGGAASVRFHRPPSGVGLNKRARAQIKSARMMLEEVDIFNSIPDKSHLLMADRESGEVYLSYIPGKQYLLYFPEGGEVTLKLGTSSNSDVSVHWLDLENSTWRAITSANVHESVGLKTPGENNGWVAVVKMK